MVPRVVFGPAFGDELSTIQLILNRIVEATTRGVTTTFTTFASGLLHLLLLSPVSCRLKSLHGIGQFFFEGVIYQHSSPEWAYDQCIGYGHINVGVIVFSLYIPTHGSNEHHLGMLTLRVSIITSFYPVRWLFGCKLKHRVA